MNEPNNQSSSKTLLLISIILIIVKFAPILSAYLVTFEEKKVNQVKDGLDKYCQSIKKLYNLYSEFTDSSEEGPPGEDEIFPEEEILL